MLRKLFYFQVVIEDVMEALHLMLYVVACIVSSQSSLLALWILAFETTIASIIRSNHKSHVPIIS